MFIHEQSQEKLGETLEAFQRTIEKLEKIEPVPLEIHENSQNLIEKNRDGKRVINLENAPTEYSEVIDEIIEICKENFGEIVKHPGNRDKLRFYPDSWTSEMKFQRDNTSHQMAVKYYADGRIKISFLDKETYKKYSESQEIKYLIDEYGDMLDVDDSTKNAVHQIVIDYRDHEEIKKTQRKNDIASAFYLFTNTFDDAEPVSQNEISDVVNGERMNITKKYRDIAEKLHYYNKDEVVEQVT